MKNLSQQRNIFLMLITILLTASCSSDDSSAPETPTQQFANVGLSFNPQTQNPTGKSVNRGSIYTWIKTINVKATSGNYSTQTLFDLVGSGGENSYIIDNVLLGFNTFVATTTTDTPQKLEVSTAPTTTATMSTLTELNNLSPYAVYSGSVTSDVSTTNANTIPTINLTTQQGRIISIFNLSPDLTKNNYYAKITITVDGVKQTEKIADKTNNVTFYWSNENATNNKEVKADIILFDNKNVQYSIMKQVSVLVSSSTSNNTIYTIKDSSVSINTVSTTSKFTVQNWNTNNSNIDSTVDTAIPSFSTSYSLMDTINLLDATKNVLNTPQSNQVNYTHNYNLIGTTYYHFLYIQQGNKMVSYGGLTEIGNNMIKDTNGNIITVNQNNVTVLNANNEKTIYHN